MRCLILLPLLRRKVGFFFLFAAMFKTSWKRIKRTYLSNELVIPYLILI